MANAHVRLWTTPETRWVPLVLRLKRLLNISAFGRRHFVIDQYTGKLRPRLKTGTLKYV